ncbi:hypothetical protein F5144DRAFT_398041 [Chaetomium tenue]|uniref:Uncharacterized protein n=1 Tax=Chaetomium tenue TaxID=1854479 RepID=A0ACB7NWM1_9PEZI|nr:hypothetical protein F5144DRAFT_398041 [Chaetomium globosum]
MCRYSIIPGSITPSGSRLYQRSDTNYKWDVDLSPEWDALIAPGDEMEDPFLHKLDPNAVHTLLLALARAVRWMPALWTISFKLEPPLQDENIGQLEVEYTVTGSISHLRSGGDGGVAELAVRCHPVFYPEEEVLQLWSEAVEEYTCTASGLVVVLRDAFRDNVRNMQAESWVTTRTISAIVRIVRDSISRGTTIFLS